MVHRLGNRHLALAALVVACLAGRVSGQDFTIDPTSPEAVPGGPAAHGDLILTTGAPIPPLFPAGVPGALLGLLPGENVDAFSYGLDQVRPMSATAHVLLWYSIDRPSLGVDPIITAESTVPPGNGAAGDKYSVSTVGGLPIGPVTLVSDAPVHGLTPAPPIAGQSNIDGLSMPFILTLPDFMRNVYYSVDPPTAAGFCPPGFCPPPVSPADVFFVPLGFFPVVPPPVIFASEAALGLVPGDDIDALMVRDIGLAGTFDAFDVVYLSLTPASPTLWGPDGAPGIAGVDDDGVNGVDDPGETGTPGSDDISPASILQAAPGPLVPVILAPDIGLLDTDNVDAATAWDPDTWKDLLDGLAGTPGVPVLKGGGTLIAGDPMLVELSNALPGTFAHLVIGLSLLGAPFKGGVLVPNPDIIVSGLPTGPSGTLPIAASWPSIAPPGLALYFQYWIADPAGPVGFAASNGLRATGQ